MTFFKIIFALGLCFFLDSAQAYNTFTRTVEQLTGKLTINQGSVYGQDSAIILPFKDRVVFFFGDTIFGKTSPFFNSNSMAHTFDLDASNGLDLIYYLPTYSKEVLKKVPPEGTVWIINAFVLGDDIYAHYLSVQKDWPNGTPLGSGLAVMRNGEPPFVRTDFKIQGDHFFAAGGLGSSVQIEDGFVYFTPMRRDDALIFHIYLVRAPEGLVANFSAYEYWTGSTWTTDVSLVAPIFDNASPPSLHWNNYMGKYMAVSHNIYSNLGISSEMVFRTADTLTGPWSSPQVFFAQEELPPKGWGTMYNPEWNPIFNRNSDRTFYTTATNSDVYNVFLRETNFEYGESTFEVKDFKDAAYQIVPKSRPLTGHTRLKKTFLPLRSEGQSIIGFRLEGSAFFPTSSVTRSEFILPLYRAPSENVDLQFKISVGLPHDFDFKNREANNLATREKLGFVIVNHSLRAGDMSINLSNSIAPLIDLATGHPSWKPGEKEHLVLYIERLDTVSRKPIYFSGSKSLGSTGIARLSACWGTCPQIPIASKPKASRHRH